MCTFLLQLHSQSFRFCSKGFCWHCTMTINRFIVAIALWTRAATTAVGITAILPLSSLCRWLRFFWFVCFRSLAWSGLGRRRSLHNSKGDSLHTRAYASATSAIQTTRFARAIAWAHADNRKYPYPALTTTVVLHTHLVKTPKTLFVLPIPAAAKHSRWISTENGNPKLLCLRVTARHMEGDATIFQF